MSLLSKDGNKKKGSKIVEKEVSKKKVEVDKGLLDIYKKGQQKDKLVIDVVKQYENYTITRETSIKPEHVIKL